MLHKKINNGGTMFAILLAGVAWSGTSAFATNQATIPVEVSLAEAPRILTYKKGDLVPFTFSAEGDLIETEDVKPTFVTVKRTFYLKLTDHGPLISFDGKEYKPYSSVLNNQLMVQANGDNPAGIGASLRVKVKESKL